MRAGKTLTEATEADGTYQHLWANYVRDTQSQGKGTGSQEDKLKGGRKGEGKRTNHGDFDGKLAQVQRAKDQQIAQLKRELEQAKGYPPAKKPV